MKHKCTKCGHVDTIEDKGRIKGGKARAKSMTAKQRSESASNAAKARWHIVQNVRGEVPRKAGGRGAGKEGAE